MAEAQLIINLGIFFRKSGDPSSAIEHYLVGLKTYGKLGMNYEIAQIQTNLAGAYAQLGQLDDALNCYQKALSSLSDLGEVDLRRGILEKMEDLKSKSNE